MQYIISSCSLLFLTLTQSWVEFFSLQPFSYSHFSYPLVISLNGDSERRDRRSFAVIHGLTQIFNHLIHITLIPCQCHLYLAPNSDDLLFHSPTTCRIYYRYFSFWKQQILKNLSRFFSFLLFFISLLSFYINY